MIDPFVISEDAALTTKELAARWGIRPDILRFQRTKGSGPSFIILDHRFLPFGSSFVVYPLANVLAYEATHNITPLIP